MPSAQGHRFGPPCVHIITVAFATQSALVSNWQRLLFQIKLSFQFPSSPKQTIPIPINHKIENDILQSQKRTVITSFYNKPTSMTVMQISGNAVTLMTVKSSQVPNRFSSLDRTLDRQNRTDAGCTFPPAPNSRRKGLFT